MLFESRSFWHAKSLEFAKEYEDAFAVGNNGVVALADGVSSAIFSGEWARILTSAVVKEPPDLSDAESFPNWLAACRAQWLQTLDLSKLDWPRRQKLQQVGGAYSTLLWTEFFPWSDAEETPETEGGSRYRMRCFAIGDCCLFHVRDGRLLRRFPLETVEEFASDPITICSVNRNRDHLLEFQILDDICLAGDLVFLTSDALAKWLYLELDAQSSVDWNGFWEMSEEDWRERVAVLRELSSDCRMRVDDTTLIMLRLGTSVPSEESACETTAGDLAAAESTLLEAAGLAVEQAALPTAELEAGEPSAATVAAEASWEDEPTQALPADTAASHAAASEEPAGDRWDEGEEIHAAAEEEPNPENERS
jgi:hypothetical protein